MRILFIVVVVILSGYLVFQHYDNQSRQNAFSELVATIDDDPINQFELKNSLNTQIQARCESLGEETADIDMMNDCLNTIKSYQVECELKVFRLAPVEFEQSKEILEYAKRYQKCVFNKQFANLVDVPNVI